MTNEEKMLQRRENVRRLFRLTDGAFVQEVLEKHRVDDAAPTADIREQFEVTDHVLHGRRWYKLRARDVDVRGETEKILYLHGGAFVLETGVAEYLYAGYLSQQTGAEIWFPEYHLAPEHSCVDAVNMVTDLYRMMLEETSAGKIAMMGASAGGGLALSSVMHFRESGLPQPNSLTLYSPCLDMHKPDTAEDQAYLEILEQRDPMISYCSMPTIGTLWRGDLPVGDYRADPIDGDLRGLAPMLVMAGTGEVLNLASRHLVKNAEAQQVPLRYVEKEMMPHCWILFPDSDNAEERKLVVETLLRP